MNKKYFKYILVFVVIYSSFAWFGGHEYVQQKFRNASEETLRVDSVTIQTKPIERIVPLNIGGAFVDGDSIARHTIKFGDTFNSILRRHFGDIPNIITQKSLAFYHPLRELRARDTYYISYEDSVATGFHIEKGEKLISLYNLLTVSSSSMAVSEKTECVSGVINGSLWNIFADSDFPTELAVSMGQIFEHQIDFYHLAAGDKFKVYYKQRRIGNNKPQIEDVMYAELEHKGKLFTALYFESKSGKGYFNEEGKSLKTAFLRSPLEYGRISSRYNPRRYHPVLRRIKAHKGTDYAAPSGTPIRAVGDGIVSKASYTRGNGNYVKIRHNKSTETQYLHMKGFAKGIRAGTRVSKGQTIGYVGSTGLATGPHVCFRYWLNGKQVDHLAIKQPPSKPIAESEQEEFQKLKTDTRLKMKELNKKI